MKKWYNHGDTIVKSPVIGTFTKKITRISKQPMRTGDNGIFMKIENNIMFVLEVQTVPIKTSAHVMEVQN